MEIAGDANIEKKTASRIASNFKFMIVNMGISSFGMSSFAIVLLWVTLALTKSPVFTGLADGITSIPLFFSLVVGAYVDRLKKKKTVAIVASLARSISVFLMFLSLATQNLLMILASIYTTAFFVGLTSDFLTSIRSSWMKEFLEEDQFKKGASIFQSVTSISEGSGYFVSGAILVLGFASAITGLIAIFVLSFIPLVFIKYKEMQPEGVQSLGFSVTEGLKYIWKTKFVAQLIFLALVLNLFFAMTGIMFTVLIQSRLDLPATFMGIVFLSMTLGIILGSALSSRLKGKIGKNVTPAIAVIGIAFIVVPYMPHPLLFLVPMFLLGIMVGIVNVMVFTGMIKKVPKDMMARVQGSLNTFALSATFISGTIGGIVISTTSITTAFLLVGVVNILVAVISIFFKEFGTVEV